MRVLFNSMIAQILLNSYLMWRGSRVLPQKKAVRIPFFLLFILEMIAYFAVYFGYETLPVSLVHNLAWLTTSWLILIGYFSLFVLILDGINLISKNPKLKNVCFKRKYYVFFLILVILIMCWGNHKFKNPTIKHFDLEVAKSTPNIDKMRIVVVSDFHIGILINKPLVQYFVDKIMEQKPDLILMVGDIIDYDVKSVIEQNLQEELKQLKAPYGVFISTGNHEYIDIDAEKYAKVAWLRDKSGLVLLQDSAILINDSFYVVAREDDHADKRSELEDIIEDIDKKLPIIVMNHEPHRLYEEIENNTDIALYGHTHDGQIFPANIMVKMLYELSHGYKKYDNTHVYVSSGLGLAGPQYRIGTEGEIVVLDVKFNK